MRILMLCLRRRFSKRGVLIAQRNWQHPQAVVELVMYWRWWRLVRSGVGRPLDEVVCVVAPEGSKARRLAVQRIWYAMRIQGWRCVCSGIECLWRIRAQTPQGYAMSSAGD